MTKNIRHRIGKILFPIRQLLGAAMILFLTFSRTRASIRFELVAPPRAFRITIVAMKKAKLVTLLTARQTPSSRVKVEFCDVQKFVIMRSQRDVRR